MAIAFVQGKALDASGTSGSLTFGSSVTSGNLLVVGITSDGGAVPTISDNHAAGTWTPVDTKKNTTNGTYGIRLWYCTNAYTGTGLTISLGGTGITNYAITIAEFSGTATSTPLDGAIHGTLAAPANTLAAPQTSAFTPSANDLAVALYGDSGPVVNETLAAGAGWTWASTLGGHEGLSGTGYGIMLIYQILTSSTSVTGAWTGSQESTIADQAVAWAAFTASVGAVDPFPIPFGMTARVVLLTPTYIP